MHGHRPALHILRVTGRIGFFVRGVLLLPERCNRQHPEEQPDSASPLWDSRFRLRVQPKPAQRRHPGTLCRGTHPHPGRDVQRRHGDELPAADPADNGRRGSPVRPGGRLPDQPAEPTRRRQRTTGLRLRTPGGALRDSDSARAIPGFDLLPDRHRHPADVASADDHSVSRPPAGHHHGSAAAGPGGDRLRPHHQSGGAHPGQVLLHRQSIHRGRQLPRRGPQRVGQWNRLCDRRSQQSSVPHHTGRALWSGRPAGQCGGHRPLRAADALARPGNCGQRGNRYGTSRGGRDAAGHTRQGFADRKRNVASSTRCTRP